MPDARVLIVAARDDLAEPLAAGLDALGWRTVTARTPAAALQVLSDIPVEAVIVDARAGAPVDLEALRTQAAPRHLPTLAFAAETVPGAELTMRPPPHPTQIALRLEQLVRTAVAEEEFELRRTTFAARGVMLEAPRPAGPRRVLTVGAPDPRFLALSNALSARAAEVTGAFTAYTAFDYLNERPFDAVVLWGGDDHSEALAIAAGMKRNTRLFHIPAVLYLRGHDTVRLGEVFDRGVADVAAPEDPEEDTARRVLDLADAYRRQAGVREALERVRASDVMDPSTGLFTPELFAAHLGRVAEGARRRRRPLSACMLRVADSPAVMEARAGGWLDRAMPQIGAMISRLVRAEDTAARLAPEVFALALPATPLEAARLVGERIAAVIGCTAFDAGKDKTPFVVEFEMGVAELQPGESPGVLLERAARESSLRRAS